MYSNKHFFTSVFSFILSGSLLILNPGTIKGSENTYTVSYGSVAVEKESKASFLYPFKTALRYEGQDAVYVSSSVKHGQTVEAGDLIMTVTPKTNPIDVEEKELELARLKNNLEEDMDLKNNELSALKRRMNAASDYWEYRKLQLDVEKSELDIEYESASRTREINRKEEEFQKLCDAVNAVEIRTPVSGTVTDLIIPEEGDLISANTLICSIEDPSSCQIKAASCPFPFGSQVQITGSRTGDELKIDASVTGSSSTENVDTDQFASYLTQENTDISFESFQNLSVSGTVSELENVLLVPTKTVHSDSSGDFVYLLTDTGKRQKQYIKAWVATSEWTWVIDGLSEGQTISFN